MMVDFLSTKIFAFFQHHCRCRLVSHIHSIPENHWNLLTMSSSIAAKLSADIWDLDLTMCHGLNTGNIVSEMQDLHLCIVSLRLAV
jgi:hypothetical protein